MSMVKKWGILRELSICVFVCVCVCGLTVLYYWSIWTVSDQQSGVFKIVEYFCVLHYFLIAFHLVYIVEYLK